MQTLPPFLDTMCSFGRSNAPLMAQAKQSHLMIIFSKIVALPSKNRLTISIDVVDRMISLWDHWKFAWLRLELLKPWWIFSSAKAARSTNTRHHGALSPVLHSSFLIRKLGVVILALVIQHGILRVTKGAIRSIGICFNPPSLVMKELVIVWFVRGLVFCLALVGGKFV